MDREKYATKFQKISATNILWLSGFKRLFYMYTCIKS